MKRRSTPSKQAILDILHSDQRAFNQEDIEQQVKGSMDRVTVYRILNRFCEDGYVHKIVSDDGKQYFALCHNCEEKHHRHNHFHFRCLKCQKVECLKEEVEVKIPTGYQLQNVNCLLTGYCLGCV
ncbi:Fur family transcriptional regulator [Adhaeribacter radiodurans]|uniref:Transcriptional repressor n=1 Tax=Adhaeribacter radiodurans TaxID=2745197 RepID=A0A7L7LEE4_9BACT|nr:transcriptional repressor [Adhaeribacter radiodurans]QMU31218.1 transcriptional repressor [Adhaeribacter radiodurans]